MFEELMTGEIMTSFTGLTSGVIVIVQFTKFMIKKKFGDSFVRLYVFLVAFVLTMIFGKHGDGLEGFVLLLLNSMMVTISSIGGYELLADPMAKKVRL